MIGPIVLVCKWNANSSKELVDQPRSGNVVSTIQDSQFSRSLQQLVMAMDQERATTYIRISQHTRVDHDIIQFQVRYCGELRNKTLRDAVLAITTRDLVRLQFIKSDRYDDKEKKDSNGNEEKKE
jgi:hypothetical protein